jgi:uncharacterized iron-regulated membrane protein
VDLAARKGVRRTRSRHAATGVWLLSGLLVLSATGLTWSRYAGGTFGAALDALRAGTPSVSTDLTGGGAEPAGGHHGGGTAGGEGTGADPAAADTVLTAARAADLTGPVEITVPDAAGPAWKVTQDGARWPCRCSPIPLIALLAADLLIGAIRDRARA